MRRLPLETHPSWLDLSRLDLSRPDLWRLDLCPLCTSVRARGAASRRRRRRPSFVLVHHRRALGSFDGGGADGGGSGRAAGGSSGAGQVEPAAYADRYLTRGAIRSSVSPLGTGVELATNLPYRIDLRVFGNYTNFDWKLTQSGFYIVVNIGMANAGAMADYYPWKSLRFSPGYLLYNTNRVSANLQANTGATFTINNVTYISDNANPVHGVGALQLGGRGFMATTGWGHIVSRNTKHWNFPLRGRRRFHQHSVGRLQPPGRRMPGAGIRLRARILLSRIPEQPECAAGQLEQARSPVPHLPPDRRRLLLHLPLPQIAARIRPGRSSRTTTNLASL